MRKINEIKRSELSAQRLCTSYAIIDFCDWLLLPSFFSLTHIQIKANRESAKSEERPIWLLAYTISFSVAVQDLRFALSNAYCSVLLCYACSLPSHFNKTRNECLSGMQKKKKEKWENLKGKTATSRHVAKTVTTKLVSAKMSVRENGTEAASKEKKIIIKWIVWSFTWHAWALRVRCGGTKGAHNFQDFAPAQNMSHSSLRMFPF